MISNLDMEVLWLCTTLDLCKRRPIPPGLETVFHDLWETCSIVTSLHRALEDRKERHFLSCRHLKSLMAHVSSCIDLLESWGFFFVVCFFVFSCRSLWNFKKVAEIPPEIEVTEEKLSLQSMCIFIKLLSKNGTSTIGKHLENQEVQSYSQ